MTLIVSDIVPMNYKFITMGVTSDVPTDWYNNHAQIHKNPGVFLLSHGEDGLYVLWKYNPHKGNYGMIGWRTTVVNKT